MVDPKTESNAPHFVLKGSNLTNVKRNMTEKKKAVVNWEFSY